MSYDVKYIGYLVLDIADSISSSGLCRVRWAGGSYLLKMPSLCGLLNQFTRDSPEVPPRAHACEKAPHVPLSQTSS